MAKPWELLDRTYSCISMHRYDDARELLEKIIDQDPQNVDAWNTYINICTTRGALENLRSQIKFIWETRVKDHDYLSAKQRFVLQHLEEKLNDLY